MATNRLHLDSNKPFDDVTVDFDITTRLDELSKHSQPKIYAVILHNDPVNSVEYVTEVIRDVFGYRTRKAVWLMLKAHITGKSRLWSGPLESAESKKNEMISRGPDPTRKHKNPDPLTVTLEKITN